MTYHRRNKNKKNKKVIAIVVILLVLFLFGSVVKNFVHLTMVPVVTVKNTITYPFKTILEQFKFKRSLIIENDELKKENRRLEIENLTVQSLRRENESLHQLLDYAENVPEFKAAKVLNQPPLSPYDTFIIDLGNAEVSVGDSAHYLGVFIGKIEEVYNQTAIVRLQSSPGETFFVSISDKEIEAVGIGGGGFKLSLPKDVTISEGEVISVDQKPIGRIDSIEAGESEAFQDIYFRYPFNINTIEFVEILNVNN